MKTLLYLYQYLKYHYITQPCGEQMGYTDFYTPYHESYLDLKYMYGEVRHPQPPRTLSSSEPSETLPSPPQEGRGEITL